MATSRTKTWVAAEVLTAAALNTEFNTLLAGINTLEGTIQTGASYKYYDQTVADDGNFSLAAVTNHGWGKIMANNGATYADFIVDNDGDVSIIYSSAGDVVANADTDTCLCIGTAATQEPLTIKNRLGSSYKITCFFWYN